jgi:hypothetical protein
MCWAKRGAHLLLQVRCAVLNGELLERFQRWFPDIGSRQIGLPWNWVTPPFLTVPADRKVVHTISNRQLGFLPVPSLPPPPEPR